MGSWEAVEGEQVLLGGRRSSPRRRQDRAILDSLKVPPVLVAITTSNTVIVPARKAFPWTREPRQPRSVGGSKFSQLFGKPMSKGPGALTPPRSRVFHNMAKPPWRYNRLIRQRMRGGETAGHCEACRRHENQPSPKHLSLPLSRL